MNGLIISIKYYAMKELLLVVVAGISFLTSCEKEPNMNVWRTTHQYFSLEVDGPENVKERREQESSVTVTDAESYKLALKEDGTGYGSGIRHDGNG